MGVAVMTTTAVQNVAGALALAKHEPSQRRTNEIRIIALPILRH